LEPIFFCVGLITALAMVAGLGELVLFLRRKRLNDQQPDEEAERVAAADRPRDTR
jgi:hypothetical protein